MEILELLDNLISIHNILLVVAVVQVVLVNHLVRHMLLVLEELQESSLGSPELTYPHLLLLVSS